MTVTHTQAEAVLALIKKHHANEIDDIVIQRGEGLEDLLVPGLAEIDHPFLKEIDNGWGIVWEAGEFEWADNDSWMELPASLRGKVFLEPVNGYTLGVYPA